MAVKARSSNDRQKWSVWEDVNPVRGSKVKGSNGVKNDSALYNTPNGRYLEMKVTFQSADEQAWLGRKRGPSPILYDLMVNPLPYCGDSEHPYPFSDLNKDCKVDFKDFVIMAAEWLLCTAPECD